MDSRKGKTTGLDDEVPDALPGAPPTEFCDPTVTRIGPYGLGDASLGEVHEFSFDDDLVEKQVAILREIEEDTERKERSQLKPAPEADISDPSSTTSGTLRSQYLSPGLAVDTDPDFTVFLDDPEAIREQRRLLEQIQRETQAKAGNLDIYNSQVREQVARLSSHVEETAALQAHHCLSDQALVRPDLHKTSPTDNVIAASQDRVETLGNGKKLLIRGTKHTYKAIANGDALVVQCPCCHGVLQVASSTVNLYCTLCQQVSSLELVRETAQSATYDNLIAGSLQQQEIDVACARKMAKLSSGSSG